MLTHVPGYNVTTDNIRSKTVKDSYVKWDAGVLVNAVTTTNSSLTLDNSHDSFYINNANAATISVTILNTINDYTANGNNSLRRVNVIIDSRSAASDRTVTFTLPNTFTLIGGLTTTRNLYHGNLQVFVVEIVNNTVNIYDGVGSYFEIDSNGDLMPLKTDADLVPRTDLSGQLGTGNKRWANVYANAFTGDLTGNADTATRATNDGLGNNIANTYQPAVVGAVIAFAGSTSPTGWLLCDGSAVSRTDYAALFAVIGTTYGAGDGTSTFNLPNLTDKFIQGNATSGTEHSAGLPEIMGAMSGLGNVSGHNGPINTSEVATQGAFGKYGGGEVITYGDAPYIQPSAPTFMTGIDFYASRSNAIYGNSTTVQPPSVTMRYIIKY